MRSFYIKKNCITCPKCHDEVEPLRPTTDGDAECRECRFKTYWLCFQCENYDIACEQCKHKEK